MMGCDIIILAGQSNAEGTGIGDGPIFNGDDRILQLYDPQDNGFAPNADGEMILKVKKPWQFLIAPAKERFCDGCDRANFGLWFATEYIRRGFLENGRKILIVNAAVGGTGFKRKHWGEGDILSDRLYDMLDTAFAQEDSRLVAFLWHQGEHDVFENMDLPRDCLQQRYHDALLRLFSNVKNKCKQFRFPIIAAGVCEDYRVQNESYRTGCDAVLNATKTVCKEIGNAFVVDTHDLISNHQAVGNNDKAHFCRQSLYVLGNRYFEKYELWHNTLDQA